MTYNPLVHTSCSALALLLLVNYSQQVAVAESSSSIIFKSVTSRGTPEYSTSSSSKSQRPISLPAITKSSHVLGSSAPNNNYADKSKQKLANLDNADSLNLPKAQLAQNGLDRGNGHKSEQLLTCSQRGGVDCLAGAVPDTDGVFCFDGSKALAHSFNEICTQASLKEKLYIEFNSTPERKPHNKVYKRHRAIDKRAPSALSVEIRNISGVLAKVDAVYLKLPFLSPRRTLMKGPETIPPYGLAIYTLDFDQLPTGSTPRHLSECKVQIKCQNCRQAN